MRCQIHTTASGSGESPAEWWYRAGIEVLDEVRGLCAAAGQWQAREVEAGDASAGSATGAAPLGGLGTSISRTPAMRQRATVTKTILDQMATGTRALTDGWDPFGRLLGGSWVYGGDAPGFWWGQLRFRAGPKTELLTPAGPGAAFLERFLASHGAGPHHFTFTVPDIAAALSRVRAAGIEPVQISPVERGLEGGIPAPQGRLRHRDPGCRAVRPAAGAAGARPASGARAVVGIHPGRPPRG